MMDYEIDKEINTPDLYLSQEYWNSLMESADTYEVDLKSMVINYLSTCGYKEAVEEFCNEAKVESDISLETINTQNQIRRAIKQGNWQEALHLINSISEKILKENNAISFTLKQQQLLQMIQEGQALKAIEFAKKEIAPSVVQSPALFSKLEDTMSLLVFDNFQSTEAQNIFKKISIPENFVQTIDESIFEFYSHHKEPILNFLVKNTIVTQENLPIKMNCTCPFIGNFENGKMLLNSISNSKQGDALFFQPSRNVTDISRRGAHSSNEINTTSNFRTIRSEIVRSTEFSETSRDSDF